MNIFKTPDRNKSVCFIAEAEAGYGVKTLELADKAMERGYAIEIIPCRFPIPNDRLEKYKEEKLKIFDTNLSVFDRSIKFSTWNNFFKSVKSPVVILQRSSLYFGTYAFLAACRKHFHKVYFIQRYPGIPMPDKKKKQYIGGVIQAAEPEWYRERFMRSLKSLFADKIIAVSNYMKDHLVDDWGYPSQKITVIHNGIYWQKYVRNEELGVDFRKRFKIPENAKVFGVLARLHCDKGVDIAIQAFNIFLKKCQDDRIYLVIVGDGPEYEKLQVLRKGSGFEKNIILCGYLTDPLSALSALDVLVIPSRKEAFGIAVIEGMAAGCLPIISTAGGMVEIVNSSEVGWTFPKEDFEALSRVMEDVFKISEMDKERIRQNARNRVKEYFDANINYQKILDTCGIV